MENTHKTDGKTSTESVGVTETQRKINEVLEVLDGQEITSFHYEDVVGIDGNKVIRAGKVIDVINTLPKARRLMNEAFENEFGYACGSKAHMKAIKEEFGEVAQ